MTLVRKENKKWVRVSGTETLADDEGNVAALDVAKIERLLADGVWTEEDIGRYGLARAEDFVPPEGERPIGLPTFVERSGKVFAEYETEIIPEPPSQEEMSVEQKLAAVGLTIEDIKSALKDAA